jgi:hypothetical protein
MSSFAKAALKTHRQAHPSIAFSSNRPVPLVSLPNTGTSWNSSSRRGPSPYTAVDRTPSSVSVVSAAAAPDNAEGAPLVEPKPDILSEVARLNLKNAANACRRCGWLSFWVQLILTTVAAVIILFSLAFTAQATGPSIANYLTLFGIFMGFLSTFWSFGYMRLATKLRAFLEASSLEDAPKIRRSDVINMLEKGAIINVLGAGAAMLALQATIGLLVAKTLSSATVNPFLASNTATWNPVLAFDVFNVQATTNTLLSHFFSLVSSLWLLRIIANRPSAAQVVAKTSAT